jgi:hypothetical protein
MQRHKQTPRRVCRQFKECPDGQRRWDQAYQHLLSWAIAAETTGTAQPPTQPPTQQTNPPATCHPQSHQSQQEVCDASSSVCPSLDSPADAKSEH